MRTVLRAALMAALGTTAFVGVACQQAPAPEPEAAAAPTDEELLHALAAGFAETWATGDAAALSSPWTEDGDTLSADGHFEGRAAIQEYYTQAFSGPYAGTSIVVETTDVRFLEADHAVADGTCVVTGAVGPDGEEMLPLEGLWTNVNVEVGGEWLIARSRPMIPEAWNAGDMDALGALYAEDSDYVDFFGRKTSGQAAVQAGFAELNATVYQGTKIEVETVAVSFVSPNVAVTDTVWKLTGLPDDAPPAPTEGQSTVVAVKKGGGWKIAAHRTRVPQNPVAP